MGTNLLTGDFSSSIQGTSAIAVYKGVIENNSSDISTFIQQRMDNVLFNGKNKAINGYNTVLSYIAAEAVLAVITQTEIRVGASSNATPSRIPANFTTINANNVVTITDTTSSTSATTGALTVAGGVGIGENLHIGGNVNITGTLTLGLAQVTADADELNILDGVTATTAQLNLLNDSSPGEIKNNKVAVYDANGILSSQDPTSGTHVANKNYVDSLAQGLSVKQSVRVATTEPGTLTTSFKDGESVDGIALGVGDRILIKDQSNKADNGIYTVTTGSPTRATDFDAGTDVNSGSFTFVREGDTNADTGWVLTTDGPITIGTSLLIFNQFSRVTLPQDLSSTSSVAFSTLTLTGALTANNLNFSSALNKNQNIVSQGANTSYTNVSVSIYDLLSKIRAMDQALTLLLQNVDISSSLSSLSPFYAGALYTGTNSISNQESLSYTTQ